MLFGSFVTILQKLIRTAKREGSYDSGIIEINNPTTRLIAEPVTVWTGKNPSIDYLRHYQFEVDRGCSWEEVQKRLQDGEEDFSLVNSASSLRWNKVMDFYISRYTAGNRVFVLLAVEKPFSHNQHTNVTIYRPSTGEIS